MNVYENCPVLENDHFRLRLVREGDAEELLRVYSDTDAVPLFNSDNCHGDDFHYSTLARMLEGIRMWLWSYEHGWFVRWSVVELASGQAVGTMELCRREGENCCILRLDLRSDYERKTAIRSLLGLILPEAEALFGCASVITKAIPKAAVRRETLEEMGFVPLETPVLGSDGTCYWDYFTISVEKICTT